MLFVMDTSLEVTQEILNKMKAFIEEQLPLYNVSSTGTRISLLAYGDKGKIIISLSEGISRGAVTAALNKSKKIGGKRRLQVALRIARDDILSKRGGARDGVGKLAVVFVAGPNDPAASVELGGEGAAMKKAGIKVLVIGIGQNVKNEDLEAMTSDPSAISKLSSEADLNQATAALSENAGNAAGNHMRISLC